MPTARRRTEITAPPERWQLLGRLLEERRKELGYTYRSRRSGPSFEADSGINKRMAADIEKAAKDRINRFMPGTLHIVARGYRVTEASVRAVLRGEADELTPAPPAAACPCLPLTARPAGRLSASRLTAATTTRSTSAASPSPPRAFSTRPARRCSPAPPTTRRCGTASAGGCPSATGCGSSRTCAAGKKPAGSRNSGADAAGA